jgi:hypothetical protein
MAGGQSREQAMGMIDRVVNRQALMLSVEKRFHGSPVSPAKPMRAAGAPTAAGRAH